MKRPIALLFCLLMLTLPLAGCFGGDDPSDGSDEELDDWNVHFAATAADLPACDADTNGRLYYVEADNQFQVCKTSGWSVIDIHGADGADGAAGADGLDGADGAPGADGQAGANGADGVDGQDGADGQDGTSILINAETTNCVNGGNAFDIGEDVNGDGELASSEVVISVDICNGANGVDGADGAQGPQGPAGNDGADGADGQDGSDGAQGPQGPAGNDGADGADGQDGATALMATSSESAGNNCASGGVKIEVGVDDNGNNQLDSNEVDSTQYVCNGGSTTSTMLTMISIPAASLNCELGSKTISHGLDNGDNLEIPANGILESGEIDHMVTYCNRKVVELIYEENYGRTGTSGFSHLTNLGDVGLLIIPSIEYGTELFTTDGTQEGTVLLKDVNPGTYSSSPNFFAMIGDKMLFRATDGIHGTELWVTDGTNAGTMMLYDFNNGSSQASYRSLGELNGFHYFIATNEYSFTYLWKTDGTITNTTEVYNFSSGPYNRFSAHTELNGQLFFTASDGINGSQIWTSDGTTAGTFMAFEINPSGDSYATYLGGNSTHFMFKADNGIDGDEPYITDGNTVTYLGDLYNSGSSFALSAMFYEGGVYFRARDTVEGYSLFNWNGSSCQLVSNNTGILYKSPSKIVDDFNNMELFKASLDGVDNFFFVNDTGEIIRVFTDSMPFRFMSLRGSIGDDYLFFQAKPNGGYNTGYEPWVFDGTENGTMLLVDSAIDSSSGNPSNFVSDGDEVYFFSNDNFYVSDGTTTNTTRLAQFNSTSDLGVLPNGIALIFAETELTGLEMFGYVTETEIIHA